MALPVLTLRVRIFLFFALLMLAAPMAIGAAIWLAYQSDITDTTRLLATYTGVGSVLLLLITVFVWQLFDRHIACALQSLGRQMQTSLHSNTAELSDKESLRYLGSVSSAANELITALHESREKEASVQLSDAGTLESRQMAAILRDLDTGVLVMNLQHKVLLYNQRALSMLSSPVGLSAEQLTQPLPDGTPTPANRINPDQSNLSKIGVASGALPGLARPAMDLFKGEALRHAAERLLANRDQDKPAIPLILSPRRINSLLQGTVGLVKDAHGKPNGYVLVFHDATPRLSLANRKEQLTQFALQGARSSVNSLMAGTRTGLADDVVLSHARQLQLLLDDVDNRYSNIQDSEWPMADYLSGDLLSSAVSGGLDTCRLQGESIWLFGNTYLLGALITDLLRHIAALATPTMVSLRTEVLSGTAQLQISWHGNPLTLLELDDILDTPLPENPTGICGRQVLNHHGTGIELNNDGTTCSLQLILGACSPDNSTGVVEEGEYDNDNEIKDEDEDEKISTQPSSTAKNKQASKTVTPSRPEFYDFDLFSRVVDSDIQRRSLKEIDYVVFDTETTGLNPSGGDEMVSIAAVRIVNGRVLHSERFDELIDPGRPVPARSTVFHGITDEMLVGKPSIREVLPAFAHFVGDSVLVAHNAAFDMKFISLKEDQCRVSLGNPVLDTVLLSAWLHDHTHNHTLDELAKRFGIKISGRHSALGDAQATAEVFVRLMAQLAARDVNTLSQALSVSNKMTHIKRHQKNY